MSLIFAVDGGGTSCKAAIVKPDGAILARSTTGPANLNSHEDLAASNIVQAAKEALKAAGLENHPLSDLRAFLGLAGQNIHHDPIGFGDSLPFAQTYVEHDAVIALEGALGPSDGIIGILGTGSAFLSRKGRHMRSVGGWGFQIGDFGSGARLGQELFQYSLMAHDQVVPASDLTYYILSEFGGPNQLVAFAQTELPTGYARYAPLVFEYAEKNDDIAMKIIVKSVDHIAAAVHALRWPECPKLCLLGGLAPLYTAYLPPELKSLLAKPKGDALAGAVSLAIRKFGKE